MTYKEFKNYMSTIGKHRPKDYLWYFRAWDNGLMNIRLWEAEYDIETVTRVK
jgi:hypothetical protein